MPQDENRRLRLNEVLNRIRGMFCGELLVEPGPTLARSFFDSGLVDRVWVFRSPTVLHDATAPEAAAVPAEYVNTGNLELMGDTLSEYLNPQSESYFSPEPSADLILATEAFDPPH